MKFVTLIGAGGHAQGIVEILEQSGFSVSRYVDPRESRWLSCPRVEERDLETDCNVALGIGGVTPAVLAHRLTIVRDTMNLVSAIHPRATVSSSASIGAGSHVLPGAIIEANVRVGSLAIINTGALIIHDAEIADGAHVAPGAVVLAGAKIGRGAMIGSGAVVLPFTTVPDGALVGALKLWRGAEADRKQ